MTRFASIAGALLATTSIATAAPLDRSGQSVEDIVYAEGDYVELSFSRVDPDVTGNQIAGVPPGVTGPGTGDVAEGYNNFSFGMKYDLTENVSLALIYDKPFGVDVAYRQPGNLLTGTAASLSTDTVTGIVKYSFPENTSVFGGLRYQRLDATATVPLTPNPGAGIPLGGLYSVTSETDYATGYVLGVAYERPEIALRVALTYNSEIEHSAGVTETVQARTPTGAFVPALTAPGTTTLTTPQSINLEAQSGVAPGTLVFGSIRWVDYSEFTIAPPRFTALSGRPLSSYDNDLWFYTIGVGRAVTDKLSVAGTIEYVNEEDAVVSALSPSDGRISIGLGGTYDVTDSIEIGVGARYIMLGDTVAGAGGVPIESFTDNTAIAAGFSIGYSF